MSNFNPYQEWLGLSGRAKPTYYQLLGVQLLESDPEKIRRGAKLQARRLQNLDVGDHAAARNQILERIGRAVVCLTDAKKKSDYDRQIREHIKLHQGRDQRTYAAPTQTTTPQSGRVTADFVPEDDLHEFDLFADQNIAETVATAGVLDESLPVAVPLSAATENPRTNQPVAEARTTLFVNDPRTTASPLPVLDEQLAARAINRQRRLSRYLRPQRSHRFLFPLTLVGVAVLMGSTLLMYPSLTATRLGSDTTSRTPLMANDSARVGVNASSPPEVDPVTEPTVLGPVVELESTIPEDDGSSKPSVRRTEDVSAPTPESAMPDPHTGSELAPSAEHLARLGQLLKEARRSLSVRDINSARDRLRQAEPLLSRPPDQAMFRRLVLLTDYVEEYWKASRDGLQQLEAGDEFKFKDTRVIVVERTSDTLVLRVRGQNVQFPADNLPIGLATTMANRWFDHGVPSTKVFQGAMMAVDPNYGTEDARKLWREATATGQVDLNDLPQILDDRYDLRPE